MGCVIIWVVVPYNNFLLDNTYLSDSFLPEAVVGLLLGIVLLLNPLLRLAGPRFMLDRWQVALIASLLLFAAIIPSNGLMRMYPRFVAETNQGLNEGVTTSRIAADANFRQQLFPDPLPQRAADGSVKTFETPISDQFIDELDEGASVPWRAWAGPMAVWGMLILAMWMMMLGLGGVVYPQWRDRERLPFPLLNVYQAFVGDGDEPTKRVLPAVFTNKAFWIAVTVVFLIHAMRGLNTFTNAVPFFPLEWNLGDYLNDSVFRNAPIPLKRHYIFFALVGVAYFIPNRYAMSIWGWVVGYSLYVTFGRSYIPAFNDGQITHQGFGVVLAIVVWTLWLGRDHWVKVGKAMLGRASGGAESHRDAIAGWMFAVGCGGMICWLTWAGCSVWWSIFATAGAAIVSLVTARIIAETGVPVFWMSRFSVANLTAMLPLAILSPNILFFTGVLYALLTRATAVSAAVMTTLALGVDAKANARQHTRVLLGGVVVLVIGFIICGAVHLHMGYNHSDITTQGKTGASTINTWERADRENYEFFTADRGQQAVGFGVGASLLWACSRFPAWPIHPVGIIFCQWSIGNLIWFSIFLGWLIKVTTTNLFGGGAYRKARPVFLGLIFGELMAVIVWTLVPVIIIYVTGQDPSEVARYKLMQYP